MTVPTRWMIRTPPLCLPTLFAHTVLVPADTLSPSIPFPLGRWLSPGSCLLVLPFSLFHHHRREGSSFQNSKPKVSHHPESAWSSEISCRQGWNTAVSGAHTGLASSNASPNRRQLAGGTESSATTAVSCRSSSACDSCSAISVAGESRGGGASQKDVNGETAGDGDWLIDSMVVGDGKQVGNFKLRKGKWYALANGARDVSSYHQVEVDSITMSDYRRRVVSLSTARLSAASGSGPPFLLDRSSLKGDMSDMILRRAKLFCLQNPGVALITGVPGARGKPVTSRFSYGWD